MTTNARPAWADETVDHALQLAAYHCRRELSQLTVNLLEFDRVDLCVHAWRQIPCLNLAAIGARSGTYGWSIPQCTRCDWAPYPGNKPPPQAKLPAIGRGRFE